MVVLNWASLYISMYYMGQEYVDAIVRKKTDNAGFHQAARSIIRRTCILLKTLEVNLGANLFGQC